MERDGGWFSLPILLAPQRWAAEVEHVARVVAADVRTAHTIRDAATAAAEIERAGKMELGERNVFLQRQVRQLSHNATTERQTLMHQIKSLKQQQQDVNHSGSDAATLAHGDLVAEVAKLRRALESAEGQMAIREARLITQAAEFQVHTHRHTEPHPDAHTH